MEEVDNIIFHFLRQLNVEISDDVKVLADLSPSTIVKSVSKCLNTINPKLDAPKSLPPGISQRIETATQIAAMCKDLGYKSEVGYQTFLYHNESDLRKVFMFLIECLPTDHDKKHAAPPTPSDGNSILWENIRAKVSRELETPWVPYYLDSDLIISKEITLKHSVEPKNQIQNEATILKNFNKIKEIEESQNNSFCQPESISKREIETLNTSLTIGSLPHVEQSSQIDVKCLKEETTLLRDQLNSMMADKKSMVENLSQVKKMNDRLDAELQKFDKIKSVLDEMGINKDEGLAHAMAKIRNNLDRLRAKSDECTLKNLSLKGQIQSVKRDLGHNSSEREKILSTLEGLKVTARELKDEYTSKEQRNAQLQKEYENMRKSGIKRSSYTKKIMEIIGNVSKQKIEIHKILSDTRELQKEINNLNGQLDRSFSITDETLFRDAKKDEQAKKAYKLLALLHSECNTIVTLVNDTGTLSREIVELEDQVEFEKSKRTEEILQRMKADLIHLQKEIQSLQ